ncbi:MAG TPA: dipeptidase [Myxococcaceae bacterium]|nr:dipeptidase [Myxococcaceae bacterium]
MLSTTALALTLLLGAAAATAPDGGTAPGTPDPRLLGQARSILQRAPLIDGHNDLPFALLERTGGDLTKVDLARRQPELPADIPRLREGRVGAQYWAIFVESDTRLTRTALHDALRVFDVALRTIEGRPELELARSAEDIVRITRAGRIASLLGVEGGQMIESSPGVLRIFHRLGARYLTLTHWGNVEFADAATDTPVHDGLTKHGELLVGELNRLGMFVDIAHVSPDVMRDVLRVTKAPVISSHSDAYALVPHPRNIPDDVLRGVARNRGVVHVSFIREFAVPSAEYLAQRKQARRAIRQRVANDDEAEAQLLAWDKANPQPGGSVANVADAIDHIRAVAGVDHVGIGGDFYDDGSLTMVEGLQDVTRYPFLFAELLRRGWSEDDLVKLAGQNHLRAMREMERVAAQLQKSTPPATTEGPRVP